MAKLVEKWEQSLWEETLATMSASGWGCPAGKWAQLLEKWKALRREENWALESDYWGYMMGSRTGLWSASRWGLW